MTGLQDQMEKLTVYGDPREDEFEDKERRELESQAYLKMLELMRRYVGESGVLRDKYAEASRDIATVGIAVLNARDAYRKEEEIEDKSQMEAPAPPTEEDMRDLEISRMRDKIEALEKMVSILMHKDDVD